MLTGKRDRQGCLSHEIVDKKFELTYITPAIPLGTGKDEPARRKDEVRARQSASSSLFIIHPSCFILANWPDGPSPKQRRF
jgi:hypothetical protein